VSSCETFPSPQIDAAIIVEIERRRPAADRRPLHVVPQSRNQIDESPAALVPEQARRLTELRVWAFDVGGVIVDVTIDEEQAGPAVVVEIDRYGPNMSSRLSPL